MPEQGSRFVVYTLIKRDQVPNNERLIGGHRPFAAPSPKKEISTEPAAADQASTDHVFRSRTDHH